MSSPCALESSSNRVKFSVRLCPICHQPLQSLGFGNAIKPFWRRLPKFFLYPVKPDALGYLAVVALCNLAGVIHPAALLMINLLSMAAIFNYGFICLNHSARGNLEPPDFKLTYPVSRAGMAFKQLGVILPMGLLLMLCSWLGDIAFVAALVFLLACIPGSTMILAIEGKMLSAVNPTKLMAVMRTTGKPYWLLYAFLLMLSAGENMLPIWLRDVLPLEALLSLRIFLTGYFSVVMFAMIGYLIFQYHEALGFTEVKEVSQESLDQAPGLSDDPFLNTINILIKEGMFSEALDRLKPKIRNGGNIKFHDLYHKLLILTGNKREASEHGQAFIRRLLAQEGKTRNDKLREVLQVYANCLTLDNHFYFPEAKAVHELAKAARQFNMHNLAIGMLKRFHEKFPNNPLIPDAYFSLAQMLIEQKNKDEDAKKLLRFVIKRYPAHELGQQIKEYLDMLGNLSGEHAPSSVGGA